MLGPIVISIALIIVIVMAIAYYVAFSDVGISDTISINNNLEFLIENSICRTNDPKLYPLLLQYYTQLMDTCMGATKPQLKVFYQMEPYYIITSGAANGKRGTLEQKFIAKLGPGMSYDSEYIDDDQAEESRDREYRLGKIRSMREIQKEYIESRVISLCTSGQSCTLDHVTFDKLGKEIASMLVFGTSNVDSNRMHICNIGTDTTMITDLIGGALGSGENFVKTFGIMYVDAILIWWQIYTMVAVSLPGFMLIMALHPGIRNQMFDGNGDERELFQLKCIYEYLRMFGCRLVRNLTHEVVGADISQPDPNFIFGRFAYVNNEAIYPHSMKYDPNRYTNSLLKSTADFIHSEYNLPITTITVFKQLIKVFYSIYNVNMVTGLDPDNLDLLLPNVDVVVSRKKVSGFTVRVQ